MVYQPVNTGFSIFLLKKIEKKYVSTVILIIFENYKKWSDFLSTVLKYHKMINIKLGTNVHLKTCILWLISLCWLSGRHRSRYLWKCYRCAPFPWPRRSSTHHRLSMHRKAEFWQFFWRRWGSESWRSPRSTASDLFLFEWIFCQWIFRRLRRQQPFQLMKAFLFRVRLWMRFPAGALFRGFFKWR